MKLVHLLRNIILEDYQIEKLKEKFVGEPISVGKYKKISDEDFMKITEVCGGKFNYIAWLTIKVAYNVIDKTDIYKFKEYFEIFERHKSRFPIRNIHNYKTKEDVTQFIQMCIKIREKNVELTSNIDKESEKNYVSPNEIQKLESVGIKFLGMSEGYQVFEIPNEVKNSKDAWKAYKDILGRCSGRDRGAKIDLCTVADFDYFRSIMHEHGGSYFLIFNLGDPRSPYQIHFESKQFMDKNDQSLL